MKERAWSEKEFTTEAQRTRSKPIISNLIAPLFQILNSVFSVPLW
jgi:hypothetical protein